jgi:hypothetical protein
MSDLQPRERRALEAVVESDGRINPASICGATLMRMQGVYVEWDIDAGRYYLTEAGRKVLAEAAGR